MFLSLLKDLGPTEEKETEVYVVTQGDRLVRRS